MLQRIQTFTLFLSAAFLMGCPHLQAGLVIRMEGDDGPSSHAFQDGHYALHADGALEMLVDLKQDSVVSFLHDQQVFTRNPLSKLPELTRQSMGAKMEQFQQNPFVQLMLQKQAEDAAKNKVELKVIGQQNLKGVKAEGHRILVNGKAQQEIWVSAELMQKVKKEFDYTRFQASMVAVREVMAELLPATPAEKLEQQLDSKGFVVDRREADEWSGGKMTVVESLVLVEEKALKADAFAMPKGYREVDFATFNEMMESEEDEDSGEEWDEDESDSW
jgi:hypothetical protein